MVQASARETSCPRTAYPLSFGPWVHVGPASAIPLRVKPTELLESPNYIQRLSDEGQQFPVINWIGFNFGSFIVVVMFGVFVDRL